MNKVLPPVASAIYDQGKVTYNYTDGTSVTEDIDLPAGIDLLTDELNATYDKRQGQLREKRIAEGRCTECGELREMTIYGLKDCLVCSN